MKDVCRICARELHGNQRRWIFHPTAKLSLQVLLSYALGREMTRDGRGEFACSKCAFMLDRMYRFDTVIARVEALSIERMQKLLLEKDRLRQCIGWTVPQKQLWWFGGVGLFCSWLLQVGWIWIQRSTAGRSDILYLWVLGWARRSRAGSRPPMHCSPSMPCGSGCHFRSPSQEV